MKNAQNQTLLWGAATLSLAVALTTGQIAPKQRPIDLKSLQGYWEGEGAGGKCSITITGNTLRYQAGTNWHETTFTLPAGVDPQQLHATIKESFPPSKDMVGAEVHAIIKIEDKTLTLTTFDTSAGPPKTFDDPNNKYVVKQVQPKKDQLKKENANPPK